MRSGCPYSEAGAYPAFQHQSDDGALASPQDNNTTPVPVIDPANGIQKNIVATQYPWDLRVSYIPGQWHQGKTQLQQNLQGLRQMETQSSITSTEFQYPKPRSPQNSLYKIRRKANTNAASENKKQRSRSLLVALLEGNYQEFESCFTNPSSSSEETSTCTNLSGEIHCKSQQVRSPPAVRNGGKTRTQNLHHLGGTHANPQQQQVSSSSLSRQPSTDKVLPVGEMVPPTDDQIQNHIAKKVAHFRASLTQQNRNDGHTFTGEGWDFSANIRDSTPQSDSIQSNSVAHFPTTSASDRVVKRQSLSCAVVKRCTATLGQALKEDSSRGSRANAELTPSSKETSDCATFTSKKPSTGTLASDIRNSKHAPKTESFDKRALVDFELSVKEHLDVTMSANEDVRHVYSGDCENKTFVCSNGEMFYSKWRDKNLTKSGVTTLCYSLTALKELIASLENVETIAEMDNFPKVIVQQYWNGDIDNIHLFESAEYPQIMGKVAATCTKNEDESPVVLTAVSGMTLDELTEKYSRSSLNCSSSQEEYNSLWLHMNKNLDHTDQMPGVSLALKHTTERGKGDTSLKPVEAGGLNNVEGVTDVSEIHQSKSSSVVPRKKTFEHTSLTESQDGNTKQVKNIEAQQCSVTRKEVAAHSKQVRNVVSTPTNQSERLCNHTIVECVKDDVGSVHLQTDVSVAISTKDKEEAALCKSKGGEALSVNIVKNPQYEDISDDEDRPQLSAKLPDTEHKELHFSSYFEEFQYEDISEDENPQIEIENVAVERPSLTQVPETNDKQLSFRPLESRGHVQGQRHVRWQTNHSNSCSPLKDETDDQVDDDWLVIPLSMSDLKFEPEDEEQDRPENVVPDDGETEDKQTQCHTYQVPASPSSQMEVFDTIESFLQAKNVQLKNRFEVASGWSTTEHELDSKGEPHTPQNRRESYSDTEDSCETEDSCDYSSGSERNYLTVPRQLLKRPATLPPETDESVSKEDENEVANVQKGQTRSLKKSGLQKLRQLIQDNAASKHVQHKTNGQNMSKKDEIIILDSDTEDESEQNSKEKAKRKRSFSSGSDGSGEAKCYQKKRRSPETVDSARGTVKEQFEKDRLTPADAPVPQQQLTLHDTRFKEVMQDVLSEWSHSSEKSGQLIETKGDSEHVQHSRQKMSTTESVIIIDSDTEDDVDQSYKKANQKRQFSSASADGVSCGHQKINSPESVDNEFESAEQTANRKTKSPRLSSEDLPKKPPQSVGKETDSSLNSNPVIPRLIVVKSSRPTEYIKLVKEPRVHVQVNDETQAPKTPTGTTKNTVCEKNTQHLHRNGKRMFMSKPKPANGRHRSTKNMIQTSAVEPGLISRQHLLPCQEGPSTSIGSLSSTSGQTSEARLISASRMSQSGGMSQSGETSKPCGLPKSKQSTSTPRPHLSSSKLQLSRSLSNPPTLNYSCTHPKGPTSSATMQSSAREHVNNNWKNSFFPTRRDRKSNLEDLRTSHYDSRSDARQGPSHCDRAPRQRHNSHNTAAPLMRKTKPVAVELTRARIRDAPRKQWYSVGDGYKWSEKPTVAKPTKGSDR
ncbi:microtubule-associated protein futsch-like isoform X1 [Chelmon rostratus]|uniref:microtubule-associated protein futsch-like isoform X1 n=1 Tax=Chelmon rostratus TaxID=109905 RepID=UPI001BE8A7F3|nr:microtubule-associated protein futsch-like isoform X1 [Chelmon rostratus]